MTHRVSGAVLVLTQPVDPTADVLLERLAQEDVPVVRLDSADFPTRTSLTTDLSSGSPEATLELPDGQSLDLMAVRSIWYRRPSAFRFVEGMTPETEAFARAEARQAFAGALHACPARWVNPPHADSRAGLKVVQLHFARLLGLAVPPTLITNDPEQARAFVAGGPTLGDSIYKRLSSMLLYTNDGELTAFQTERVSADALERIDQVSVTPCLFQRYVEKAYEIRATVIGERVVAARVFSQESQVPGGTTDWRVDLDLKWSAYELPPVIQAQLVQLVDRLGLVFGAVDLIRRPDGEYVFLEVNPSGQWAWFDDDVTMPIRDALADELLKPLKER